MNVYENQILHSSILSFDPVIRKREINAAGMPGDPRKGNPNAVPVIETYPGYEVFEDGSMEIRHFAPNAKDVRIRNFSVSSTEDIVFEKREDGYFVARLTDVPVGYYWFRLLVDGNETISPDLPISYTTGYCNFVDMVGPSSEYYLYKDVPHGAITQEYYKSEITGRARTCWVYTPPSYSEDPEKRYPVLYMHHGGGSEATCWFWQARMNLILDNMLAEGKCQEMIVVANWGYAYKEVGHNRFEPVNAAEVITRECVPFIDGKYRTIPDRRSRAAAGLSYGGGLSRQMVHDYPEVFANLGQFSSGAGFEIKAETQGRSYDYSDLFSTPEHFNDLFDVTFVMVGQQDMRIEYTKPQVLELIEKGYNIIYKDYPGGHEFKVWREALKDFLPLLWK